jgi:hypothetical protein
MAMRNTMALLALAALLLASLACSFSFDLPDITIDGSPGPTVTEDIAVPLPEGRPADLVIGFAAGRLTIAPAEQSLLVAGSARYNIEQLAPVISTKDGRVRLSTGEADNLTDLDFDFGLRERTNKWNLTLATEPMALELNGGAFQGDIELGGLALEGLSVSNGAADVSLSFAQPNASEMGTFEYNTGASSAELIGLANAAFDHLRFSGGAGEFTLDFTGELRKPADVSVEAALSSITLVIPADLNAEVDVEGALVDVRVPDGFSQSDGSYRQAGDGPQLTIRVRLGAGELQIERP